MILEHLYQGEPGAWKIVFRASAAELDRALEAERAQAGPSRDEEDLLAGAVTGPSWRRTGFPPSGPKRWKKRAWNR